MWTLRKRIDQIQNPNQAAAHGTECGSAMNDPRLTPPACRGRRVRSVRGQALVEVAMVLPLLFMLLCAVIDFSHLFYVEMTLQNALREAGRYATTGNHLTSNGTTLTRVNSIIATAQQAAAGLNVSSNSINISSVKGGAGSAGGPGDIVTISTTNTVQMLTPVIAPFFKPNGTYNVTVSVSFKNEPFPAAQTN